MTARDLGECNCDCHRFKSMKHCMPCCQPCPHCKRRIKWGFREHVEKCYSKRRKETPVKPPRDESDPIDDCAPWPDRERALQNELGLVKAQRDAAGSVLLEVQQDCVRATRALAAADARIAALTEVLRAMCDAAQTLNDAALWVAVNRAKDLLSDSERKS